MTSMLAGPKVPLPQTDRIYGEDGPVIRLRRKPDRILAWMNEQEFPICDTADHDKNTCNVYKSLKFPPEVHERIAGYYQD
jgi:hypothetical protein